MVIKGSGVYCILCLETRQRYIGASKHLAARRRLHLFDLRRNRHSNLKLQEAYNKGYCLAFLVLEACEAPYLSSREQFYYDAYKPNLTGFNLTPNATRRGLKLSEDQRKKLSAAFTGRSKGPYKTSRRYSFYDPKGNRVDLHGLQPFCKRNGLQELCMRGVAAGRYSQHRGWRLFTGADRVDPYKVQCRIMSAKTHAKLEEKVYAKRRGHDQPGRLAALAVLRSESNPNQKDYVFIDPTGAVVSVHGLARFCRKTGLNYRKMLAVWRRERPVHKGWKAISASDQAESE